MWIRIAIFLALLYLLYRIIKSFLRTKYVNINISQARTAAIPGEDLVEDIYCHTYVPASQAYKKEIAGKDHYFCSKECCESYILEKNQEKR
jgi:uncharacterized protein